MKIILYMAISVNGMIAKTDGDSDWLSAENTADFYETCQKIGAVIMGKNTYDLLTPEFLPLKDGVQVVVTHEKLISDNKTLLFTDQEPKEIIKRLEEMGYTQACVIGGGKIATLFFKTKLIDEMIVNVEPMLLGRGMPIVSGEDFEYKVKLLESKKLSEDTIQLRYKVQY